MGVEGDRGRERIDGGWMVLFWEGGMGEGELWGIKSWGGVMRWGDWVCGRKGDRD